MENTFTKRQTEYLFSTWGVYTPLPRKGFPITVNLPDGTRQRVTNITIGRGRKMYMVESV